VENIQLLNEALARLEAFKNANPSNETVETLVDDFVAAINTEVR